MRKINLSLILLLITFVQVIPQEKLLTVEDVVLNSFSKLAPDNLRDLKWVPDTDKYTFIENSNTLMVSDVKSKKNDTLLTVSELNKKLEEYNSKKLSSLVNINWINSSTFTFWNSNQYFEYNTNNNSLVKIVTVDEESENKSSSPNNKFVAFTKGNNLFLSVDNSEPKQITFETDTNIICGQPVHRNEFGINGGIFWSPSSNYIAFYRMDESMVTDYPIVDLEPVPAKLKNIKYPMAGQASHHVTIGIYELKSGKTTWLITGEPLDQYLTNIAWSPDEKNIYVAHLNRDQNHMQLKKYNVTNGELIKILFEEKDDEFVEPLNPVLFLPSSNNKFLWQSERDGYNHIYLYDTEGNLISQVTKGNWVVTDLLGFDNSGKNIFIRGTKESPLERHVYKVNMDNGKLDKLTKEPGTHSFLYNSKNGFYFSAYSNQTTPRVINIYNKKNELVKNLLTAENPYTEYQIGNTKIFSIKNEDGIELYCRLILPDDFDESKKYPVIVYVYGGPHSQGITNSFGFGRYFTWFYMMAQKGYIVFELDNRGTANRGSDFAQATFRRLGTIEVQDQMAGVNYLKTLPYIDENRFGVFGWSYGGFMTTSLMLRTNNSFKVGVAGGSVIDWKFYEVMYTERYMDTPETNPEGYKESSLLNYVENLNGKLLQVHGTSDPVVVWQHTLSLAKKAAELNKPLDYYPYIGHEHGVRGIDALHLYTKITNYFIDNL